MCQFVRVVVSQFKRHRNLLLSLLTRKIGFLIGSVVDSRWKLGGTFFWNVCDKYASKAVRSELVMPREWHMNSNGDSCAFRMYSSSRRRLSHFTGRLPSSFSFFIMRISIMVDTSMQASVDEKMKIMRLWAQHIYFSKVGCVGLHSQTNHVRVLSVTLAHLKILKTSRIFLSCASVTHTW